MINPEKMPKKSAKSPNFPLKLGNSQNKPLKFAGALRGLAEGVPVSDNRGDFSRFIEEYIISP